MIVDAGYVSFHVLHVHAREMERENKTSPGIILGPRSFGTISAAMLEIIALIFFDGMRSVILQKSIVQNIFALFSFFVGDVVLHEQDGSPIPSCSCNCFQGFC